MYMPASVLTIDLQRRDITILRGLFESRIMTREHVAALFFDGRKEAAKKRVQKLKAAGLIGERRRRAYEPAILFLTKTAFAVLHDNGILKEYPPLSKVNHQKRVQVSDLTIRHELQVMDVKAAFHSTIGTSSLYKIAEFSTWPLLNQFELFGNAYGGTRLTVKPDAFIRIHEDTRKGGLFEHTFFLEVDRSTEVLDVLVNRARCYLQYYSSGGFARRNGAMPSAFKEYPFRVLIVFKTAERRNNIAERLLQNNPPVLTQACLSTYEEVISNPLGQIWITPQRYGEAVQGTIFDASRVRPHRGYKRESARDLLVEEAIKKLTVLD